jgi:tellurite resistance protein
MISHHAALIYTMVLISASDREMTDAELRKIGEIIGSLPVFADYPRDQLPQTAAACADLLDVEEGLDKAFALIEQGLPVKLRETAYALACEVAAADGRIPDEEARMLEMVRHRLHIERLAAAAIERAARARYTRA